MSMTVTKNGTRPRRAASRARVKSAARDLNHAVIDAGGRVVRQHPWAVTTAGFAAGFAIPFLFRSRESRAFAPERALDEIGEDHEVGGIWRRARSIAIEAFACAAAASLDRLIGRATDAVEEATDECS
jgi:hypothetical protein